MKSSTDRIAYGAIGLISIVVFIFLFWLIYFKSTEQVNGGWTVHLPAVNAFLNTTTAILLVLGVHFIKMGKQDAHIRTMLAATISSGLFLMSYILYHHHHGDTKFLAQGLVRYFYFFILISHILLSAIQVPMVLATLYHAFKKNFLAHKKFARWTYPIWLYVAVSGVLIFVFIKLFN